MAHLVAIDGHLLCAALARLILAIKLHLITANAVVRQREKGEREREGVGAGRCLEIASFVRGEASLLCAFLSSLNQLQLLLCIACCLHRLLLLQSISSFLFLFQFQFSAERCKIEIILRPGTSLKCSELHVMDENTF